MESVRAIWQNNANLGSNIFLEVLCLLTILDFLDVENNEAFSSDRTSVVTAFEYEAEVRFSNDAI